MIAKVGDIAENLVADRADLDGDPPLFRDLEKERMFEKGDPVAYPPGREENGVEKILVFRPVRFPGMKV